MVSIPARTAQTELPGSARKPLCALRRTEGSNPSPLRLLLGALTARALPCRLSRPPLDAGQLALPAVANHRCIASRSAVGLLLVQLHLDVAGQPIVDARPTRQRLEPVFFRRVQAPGEGFLRTHFQAWRGTPVARIEERRLGGRLDLCLLYTSPSPRDGLLTRMP